MINFFRKIRKQMADENRPLKYMRYAIGEILLVVVGILIALQINTWNEERKLNAEEQYLLKELLVEFETNFKKIKNDQLINNISQKASLEILELIDSGNMENSTKNLDSLFMGLFSYASFNASTGVLNEIISSGKLRVIKDDSLRNMLTGWPGWIDNQQEDIDIRREQINLHVVPFFVRYAPFKNGDNYLDFTHWSDKYKRNILDRSELNYDYKALSSREFEGILYKLVLDQDFVLLNDVDTEVFIENVIQQIKININND